MSRYLCHDEPDLFEFEAEVLESRPGAVRLNRTTFYPGGGGQLPDQGCLEWQSGKIAIAGFEDSAGRVWHLMAEPLEISGAVRCEVDRDFRFLMQQLHTDLHIVNALVFEEFDGALVTGVQMAADGTARIDFDLPDADDQRIRALEPQINDAIAQDLAVYEVSIPSKIADMKAVAAGLPLKRMDELEEVAAAVLWLVSDASSFVVGHNLSVDDGFLSQ